MAKQASRKSPPLPAAALTALGVVFSDLGASPLYTLQTVVGAVGGRFTAETALGTLSLIVWTLIITVSIKYCLLVMRADNRGEGGIPALMSLLGANRLSGKLGLLTAAGLSGAALIYGDGVITPAISGGRQGRRAAARPSPLRLHLALPQRGEDRGPLQPAARERHRDRPPDRGESYPAPSSALAPSQSD
jgi:potassium transporter